MKNKKRILSFFLTMAMVFTMFPLTNTEASASYTDAFQFDSNGKFRIMSLNDIQDGRNVNKRVIAMITNAIARYKPDLVVFIGDNVTGGLTTAAFKSSVNQFLKPLLDTNTKYAVTFGNHDDEGWLTPSKQTQYNYYISHGGNNAVDHDVEALTGVGNGVIPIYPNGQTSGNPAFQVYLMDSGTYAPDKSYDCPYTNQIDYYIQRSMQYPDVPSLWYQHIIVPDVYDKCMTTSNNGSGVSFRGNGSPFSSNTYWLQPSRINWAKSGLATTLYEMYKEGPCPANLSTYQSAAHRSSPAYGSKTLYESWVAHGNMLGTYYGHDHKNSFVSTTTDGIDIGFSKGATLNSYNDGNPGFRIYDLDENGTYASHNATEADLAKAQIFFDANGGSGEMFPQLVPKNATFSIKTNAYSKDGSPFLGWATSPSGSVAYQDSANYAIGMNDVTLYAKWGETSTITFDANGGSGGIGPTLMDVGTALTPPNVSKTGYTFSWSPPLPATVPSVDTTYTAQWSPNIYTVNYNGNGSTYGSTASSSHAYDTAKNLTANGYARVGNTFLGWSINSGATVADFVNEQSVTNLTTQPNGAVYFYAVWSANDYLIAFDANGGEGGTSDFMRYGMTLDAPAVTKTGHSFVGWSPEVPPIVPADNTTYTAQWDLNSYTITFDANDGTGGTSELMPYGTSLTPPTVTRENHTLLGWSPEVPNRVPGADTTYTAQWSANSYTITFDAGGGVGGTSGTEQYGDALIPPAVIRTGYSFAGWLPTPPETIPAENATYVAQWSAIEYTITFDANGGIGGTTSLLAFDSLITPPVVVKPGFIFTGWTPAVPATVPAANATYTARWTTSDFIIHFDANGGSGDTSGTYEVGAPLSAPIVEKTGHTFIGWSPAVPSTVPAVNTTYTAQWSVNSYRIIFEAAGGHGGTSAMLTFGSLLTPPTVARVGYEFVGWSPSVPTSVPAANTTFIAQWAPGMVTITFEANGGIGGAVMLMPYGSALMAPTVTRTGHTFTGWSPSLPANVPATNTTYTALWNINSYRISFDANGGSGTGPSAQIARFGATVILPTQGDIIKQGFEFRGWALTAHAVKPLADFSVPADHTTLYAVWAAPSLLTAQVGSTTVVNSVENRICGLKAGITFEEFKDDFVTVTGNASLIISSTTGSFGTGTKVEVVDNETQTVIENFTVIIFGDVNGDGNIDGIDAGILIDVENYANDWDPITAAAFIKAGDLNGDGNLDSVDAGIITDEANHKSVLDQTTGLVKS
ncbi:MAG TPA: InlB B-repeat-containing protein [Clostridia bacterium]|nr:InlB B-repeat-containing protein [Clostridia bacterium]